MKFHSEQELSVDLGLGGDGLPVRHCFEVRQIRAIQAALAANRPLLVRGEPGVGKSQLARAAAVALGRAYVQQVVDARTESRDLLWHFDAVGRLAKAQVLGALQIATQQVDPNKPLARQVFSRLEEELAVERFLQPRALWWAFDWISALERAGKLGLSPPPQTAGSDANEGCVVLIDEIDKAEPDVPNGLLEALGARQFTPEGRNEPVAATGPAPLVIITTNEERTLPEAFVRRCLVLHMALPKEPDRLAALLIERGRLHFGEKTSATVLQAAAQLLVRDRSEAEKRHWRPLPGQAEYLDLVRSVVVEAGDDLGRQECLIRLNAQFMLKKHPEAAPDSDAEDGDEDRE